MKSLKKGSMAFLSRIRIFLPNFFTIFGLNLRDLEKNRVFTFIVPLKEAVGEVEMTGAFVTLWID